MAITRLKDMYTYDGLVDEGKDKRISVNFNRSIDVLNAVFPKGYDSNKEHFARGIAGKIGYAKLSHGEDGLIEEVDIDNIYPCQNILNKSKVFDLILYIRKHEVPGYPMGMKIGDDFYLLDGHHRVSAQILMGKKKVMMHYTDMTDIKYEHI